MRSRILIVGGGIMGTSIALEAARRTDSLRAPVVLLERSSIGAGTTGRSGAILRQNYSDRILASMARESLRHYAQFESFSGRSIGFQRTGALTLASPDQPEWIEVLESNVATSRELGIPMELVNAGRMREIVPGIRVLPGTVGAWEPDAGYVDVERTLDAVASLARSYGAVTRLSVEATEVLIEGGRVTGVRTDQGDYTAEQVVLVAGPWTGKLLSSAGIDMPLRVVQPENVFFAMPDFAEEAEDEPSADEEGIGFDIEDDPFESYGEQRTTLAPRGTHPILIDLEHGFYARCEFESNRVRVGRTDYDHDRLLEDPDDIAEDVPDGTTAWARAALSSRMPEYAERADAGSLVGWYTLTPDAQGMMGQVPDVEGLYVVTGFSGHGFKLAPSVGLGMAQMLFDEPITGFETEFFSPARFQGEVVWTGKFGL